MSAAGRYSEAATRYGTAHEMLEGAAVIFVAQPTAFLSTINFILGFAVELFLKAALSESGEPDVSRFGHRLQPLFDEANGNGLLEFSHKEQLRQIVSYLAPGRGDLSFRYFRPASSPTYITSIGPAIFALRQFDALLRQRINLHTS